MRYWGWIILLLSLQPGIVSAQSFSGTGGSIPDNGTPVTFPVSVSSLPTGVDTTFGLLGVCMNIIHPHVNDLEIWLIAPDSTWIELSTGNGGSGNNYWQTCFADTAPVFISSGSSPFTGTYRPESPIYVVNNGQNPNSTWQLYIRDTYPLADQGILTSWTITFGANPPQGLLFQSSNLPIIKINTLGQAIPDDPKITARMQIIDNGPGIRNNISDSANVYDGFIGIEVRGSSSQTFPKKSFGLETRDSLGANLSIAPFGMPSENDWILNANYTDKTFMRSVLSYDRSRTMGHYASRHQYCEVILNGQYQGIYVFLEKIKRDSLRVDIAKLTPADLSGDDLTGGYILKIDKTTGTNTGGWNSMYTPPSGGPAPVILYEYPDGNTLHPLQAQYIEAYCDSFETALHGPNFMDPLNGYRRFIEMGSWVDFFIMNEFSKNVDGYRISSFFYKEKDSDGGLLHMGPVWDFDIAWGNADYYGGNTATGYIYPFNYPGDPFQVPFWWSRLMQDPYFRNSVRCRWEDLRNGTLSTPVLHGWIDSVASYLNESQTRNFQMWPILGTYVWPNPAPIPPDYAGNIQELKNRITARANWLDANLPGNCSLAGLSESQRERSNAFAYPNPCDNETWILLPRAITGNVRVSISSISGQIVDESRLFVQGSRFPLTMEDFQKGMYLITVSFAEGEYRVKVMKD